MHLGCANRIFTHKNGIFTENSAEKARITTKSRYFCNGLETTHAYFQVQWLISNELAQQQFFFMFSYSVFNYDYLHQLWKYIDGLI